MKTFNTFPLQLVPLPTGRLDDSAPPAPLLQGFVDDEVIASLISQPPARRTSYPSSDLALSADENDFAGWAIHGASPFRVIAEKHDLAVARVLPADADVEPGLGEPHRGQHRWWVAAAASAAATLIFALLLINLTGHPSGGSANSSPQTPVEVIQSAIASLGR